MDEVPSAVIAIVVGMLYSVFNILTILIIILDSKLRRRPSNCTIISYLVGSAIQGLLPAPMYIYKIIRYKLESDVPTWLCDGFRFSYIYCGHITKLSIMLISCERFVAVKCPFLYKRKVTRLRLLVVLIVAWLLTLGVDVIPFTRNIPSNDTAVQLCNYNPGTVWGRFVVIVFNLIPFVIININYGIIWRVSCLFSYQDKDRIDSIKARPCILNVTDSSQGTKPLQNLKSSVHNTVSKLKFTFELKATKRSLAIVGVYLIFWIPMGVFFVIDNFCEKCVSGDTDLTEMRRAVKIMAFSSSLITPLVYCWWNLEFRRAVRRISRKKQASLPVESFLSE